MSLHVVQPGEAPEPTPTTLYRAFDVDGALLYVGMSTNALGRVYQHQLDKPWWSEVVRIELAHYVTREAAAEAEGRAIAEDGPKYNVAGARTPSAARAARQRELDEFRDSTWLCRGRVRCLNCGDQPNFLPKGQLVVEADCPNCGCPTLELEAA